MDMRIKSVPLGRMESDLKRAKMNIACPPVHEDFLTYSYHPPFLSCPDIASNIHGDPAALGTFRLQASKPHDLMSLSPQTK
jgi:hypothetical protein